MMVASATVVIAAEPIKSPYRSLAKTKQFLDTAALRVMFQLDYVEGSARDRSGEIESQVCPSFVDRQTFCEVT